MTTSSVDPCSAKEPHVWGCIAESELAEEIVARSVNLTLKADGVIFRQGDAAHKIFLVKRGEVLLTMRSRGQLVMVARAQAGSVLGLPAIIAKRPYAVTAKARPDAEICQMGARAFMVLMERSPRVAVQALKVLAAETRSALDALASLASEVDTQNE